MMVVTSSKVGRVLHEYQSQIVALALFSDGSFLTVANVSTFHAEVAAMKSSIKHWSPSFELWREIRVGYRVVRVFQARGGSFLCGGYHELELRSLSNGSVIESLSEIVNGSYIDDILFLEGSTLKSTRGEDRLAISTRRTASKSDIRISSVKDQICWMTFELLGVCKRLCELSDDRIAGGINNFVHVWSLNTGECLHTLSGYPSVIQNLVELDNGAIAASCEGVIWVSSIGNDNRSTIYEIETEIENFVNPKRVVTPWWYLARVIAVFNGGTIAVECWSKVVLQMVLARSCSNRKTESFSPDYTMASLRYGSLQTRKGFVP